MSMVFNWFEEFRGYESDDALNDEGYVMELIASTGHIQKCQTSNRIPYGINFQDTKEWDGDAWTATSGKVVPLQRFGWAKVHVTAASARDTAIAINDILIASAVTDGCCTSNQESKGSETAWSSANIPDDLTAEQTIVGSAKEALAASADDGTKGGSDKILVELKIQGGMR